MLKKIVMVNGAPYQVTIEDGYNSSSNYIMYSINFYDNNCDNAFTKDFILKRETVPNYIQMVQEAREAFKQELVDTELWIKARIDFENWDGGEASSEAPHSEVSA